jgi:hypothetical protein
VDLVVSGHEHHYERTLPVRGHEDQFLRPKAASHEIDQIDTRAGSRQSDQLLRPSSCDGCGRPR